MTGILLQLAYLAAIGFSSCATGWILLRADKNKAVRTLVLCQILIIIWCLPQLFLAFPMSRTGKYILYGVSYIGISLIGPSWLMFSLFYCGRKPNAWAVCLLYGISVFNYGVFLTNDIHHLFYRRFELAEVRYGPMFYFHMAYTYACVLSAMAAVSAGVRKKRVSRVHGAVIILAAAAPFAFNMVYLSGLVKSGFDLTPPVFALSSFLMLFAVFRYDFLDVDTAASRRIFASIAEGIVICNRRGAVTYCNHTAFRRTGAKNGDRYDDILEKFSFKDAENDEVTVHLSGGESLRLRQYTIHGKRGGETARILVITDISEYFELVRQSRELAVSQQRLAIEQERNRIAQEVHDTTGHTLTMLNSLIKLIALAYKEGAGGDREESGTEHMEDRESGEKREDGEKRLAEESRQDGGKRQTGGGEIEEYLRQAQELASGGIRELRWSINHLRRGTGCELVSQGVYQLAAGVREVEVEVELQGEDGPEYSHLSAVIYQCVREAITNCLKYAHATHMDVIVKFGEQNVSVYIFDNGQGCASVEESHGLKGIRERAAGAGGMARFLSAEGEGFQIFLQLPVNGGRDYDSGSDSR